METIVYLKCKSCATGNVVTVAIKTGLVVTRQAANCEVCNKRYTSSTISNLVEVRSYPVKEARKIRKAA